MHEHRDHGVTPSFKPASCPQYGIHLVFVGDQLCIFTRLCIGKIMSLEAMIMHTFILSISWHYATNHNWNENDNVDVDDQSGILLG